MSRVVISGYYGYGNVGDEIVLESLVHWLRESNLASDIVVLSADPYRTSARLDVRSVHRYNPFRVMTALVHCDLLLSGGGSLIQDLTSVRSSLYYLGILAAATLLRRKVAVAGQGIGPIRSGLVRKLTQIVLSGVDYISLRDQGSVEYLSNIGVPQSQIRLGADLAFLQSSPGVRECEPAVAKRWPVVVVVPPRRRAEPHLAWPGLLIDGLATSIRRERQLTVVAFQPGDTVQLRDGQVLRPPAADPVQADRIIRGASVVVSCRLHGLVLAVRAGVPCIAVGSDPKIRDFALDAGLPWIDPDATTQSAVSDRVCDHLSAILNDYSAEAKAVQLACLRLSARAREGMDGLSSVLQS